MNSHLSFLKPFGYSSKRTVLQITTFWIFLAIGLGYHFLKWNAARTAKANAAEAAINKSGASEEAEEEPVKDVEKASEPTLTTKEGSTEGSDKENAIEDTA